MIIILIFDIKSSVCSTNFVHFVTITKNVDNFLYLKYSSLIFATSVKLLCSKKDPPKSLWTDL